MRLRDTQASTTQAVLLVTVGHRTISGHIANVSVQYYTCPEKMSGQKRFAAAGPHDDGPPTKKRGVTAKTVDKWIADNDRALNTTTWLKYDRVGREFVSVFSVHSLSR